MQHILTFKDSQTSVDRFSSFVSTEPAARHVHVDDDVAFVTGQVGQPVNPPLAGDLLTARADVSKTYSSLVRIVIQASVTLITALKLLSECKIDSYLDITLRKGST